MKLGKRSGTWWWLAKGAFFLWRLCFLAKLNLVALNGFLTFAAIWCGISFPNNPIPFNRKGYQQVLGLDKTFARVDECLLVATFVSFVIHKLSQNFVTFVLKILSAVCLFYSILVSKVSPLMLPILLVSLLS